MVKELILETRCYWKIQLHKQNKKYSKKNHLSFLKTGIRVKPELMIEEIWL